MRKVYFISQDYGAQAMRGSQMATAIKSLCDIDAQGRKTDEGIHDSIVVFVKYATPEQVLSASKRGNVVVVDVVDRFAYKMPIDDVLALREADYLIAATVKATKAAAALCGKEAYCIPHHWDPRLTEAAANYVHYPYELRFGYIGMEFNHAWKNIPAVTPIYHPAAWIDMAPLFTCHFSVRDPKEVVGSYKPPTKLVTASALPDTCIVLAREEANLELLPAEYPYFVDEVTPEGVVKTLQKVMETFNDAVWWEAARMMREVKERTDLRQVCKTYAEALREMT